MGDMNNMNKDFDLESCINQYLTFISDYKELIFRNYQKRFIAIPYSHMYNDMETLYHYATNYACNDERHLSHIYKIHHEYMDEIHNHPVIKYLTNSLCTLYLMKPLEPIFIEKGSKLYDEFNRMQHGQLDSIQSNAK